MGLLPLVPVLVVAVGLVYGCLRVGPRYFVKRLAGLVVALWGVSFVTFMLGYVSPDDAISAISATCSTKCTSNYIRQAAHLYGLDRPWYDQYARFLIHVLHGDLGMSIAVRGLSVGGPSLVFVVGSAFFIESAFQIPGIGWAGVEAVQNSDIPVLQGVTLLVACSVVVMSARLRSSSLSVIVTKRVRRSCAAW